MRLLKALIAFVYFWSVLAFLARWLAGHLLRSKLGLAVASLFLVAVVATVALALSNIFMFLS